MLMGKFFKRRYNHEYYVYYRILTISYHQTRHRIGVNDPKGESIKCTPMSCSYIESTSKLHHVAKEPAYYRVLTLHRPDPEFKPAIQEEEKKL